MLTILVPYVCAIFLWQGTRGKCQCAVWEESLRRAGVRRVYREPYRFAPAEKFRAATWRSYSNATVA